MVQVWKTKSLLFCLRYDPLIVFRRQNHITFIFIKTMSHDLLVQMAYFDPSGETQKKENFYKYSRGSHKRLRREKMVATRSGCLREWKRVYIFFNSKFFHNAGNEKWYEHEPQTVALGSKPTLVTRIARTGLGTRLTKSQSCKYWQLVR